MMGMAKQLGGELLGSALGGGKKKKHGGHGGQGGQMSDAKLMKEALKVAKHKGDSILILTNFTPSTVFQLTSTT
jgi:hypothetical protein